MTKKTPLRKEAFAYVGCRTLLQQRHRNQTGPHRDEGETPKALKF